MIPAQNIVAWGNLVPWDGRATDDAVDAKVLEDLQPMRKVIEITPRPRRSRL